MATIGSLVIKVAADHSKLKPGLAEAGKQVAGFGQQIDNLSKRMKAMGQAGQSFGGLKQLPVLGNLISSGLSGFMDQLELRSKLQEETKGWAASLADSLIGAFSGVDMGKLDAFDKLMQRTARGDEAFMDMTNALQAQRIAMLEGEVAAQRFQDALAGISQRQLQLVTAQRASIAELKREKEIRDTIGALRDDFRNVGRDPKLVELERKGATRQQLEEAEGLIRQRQAAEERLRNFEREWDRLAEIRNAANAWVKNLENANKTIGLSPERARLVEMREQGIGPEIMARAEAQVRALEGRRAAAGIIEGLKPQAQVQQEQQQQALNLFNQGLLDLPQLVQRLGQLIDQQPRGGLAEALIRGSASEFRARQQAIQAARGIGGRDQQVQQLIDANRRLQVNNEIAKRIEKLLADGFDIKVAEFN